MADGLLVCAGILQTFLILAIIITNTGIVCGLRVYAPPPVPPTTPSPNANDLNLPYIHLLNGTEGDLYQDVSYYNPPEIPGLSTMLFHNETTYVASSSQNTLSFQCEASYPIFWNLAHSELHPTVYNSLRVLSIRQFDDPFDPSSFKYATILTMTGPNAQLTGRYSCQSAARHEIQSNVYVFWECK